MRKAICSSIVHNLHGRSYAHYLTASPFVRASIRPEGRLSAQNQQGQRLLSSRTKSRGSPSVPSSASDSVSPRPSASQPVKYTMGKKKEKRRAREAAAAAKAQQDKSSAESPATQGPGLSSSGSSAQGQTIHPFSGGYQAPPQWPAMSMPMATNGFASGPSFASLFMMNGNGNGNGAQNFDPGWYQPDWFANKASQFPLFSMLGMPFGNMAFSTAQSGWAPNQPHLTPEQPQASQAGASESHFQNNTFSTPFVSDPDTLQPTNPKTRPSPPPSRNGSRAGRAEIQAPSAKSGGVPEPTDLYIVRASFMPRQRPKPGPLLVVIDLNGTLLYRPDRKRPYDFRARPHAQKFVSYCVETFWVVIWSSARPENVQRMVAELLSPEQLERVVAVWGRDRFGLTQEDYNSRTQCYKRLTTLWDDDVVKASYPVDREGVEGRRWNQGNTVLIDDSVEKARSEPHNAITIPEFTGSVDEDPGILPRVHDYLNDLCFQEDVSTYIRVNPFKMA